MTLHDLGEDRAAAEQQLLRWRFHPALSSEAVAWAYDHAARRRPSTEPEPEPPQHEPEPPTAARGMLGACYCEAVGNLQIKNLPAELHEKLRARAAEAGMTQRDYVLNLIERDLSLPSKGEFIRRLQADPPSPGFDAADAVRAGRGERIAYLDARDDEILARHEAAQSAERSR
jgi:hypothetical protein